MKIDHILYVKTIAEYGSISTAANILFLSQPYLSAVLSNVEKELGIVIFNRNNKGVTLTPVGEEFLSLADELNSTIVKINNLNKIENKEQFKISTFSTPYVSRIADKYHKVYEDIKIDQMLSKQGEEQIIGGKCDMAIIYCISKQLDEIKYRLSKFNLEYNSIHRESTYILIGNNHPLFNCKEVNRNDMLPYPFACEQDFVSDIKRFFNDCFPKKVFKPFIFSQTRSMINQIMHSDYFTVGIKGFNHENILIEKELMKIIPLSDCPFEIDFGYITLKDATIPQSALEFIDDISTILKQEI